MEQNVVQCKQSGVDGPVRVDRDQFEIDQQKPESERLWSEWTEGAPVVQAPPVVPVVAAVAPPAVMLVMKTDGKFFVVNSTGVKITGVEGIDEDGYKTQAAATKAIEALKNA